MLAVQNIFFPTQATPNVAKYQHLSAFYPGPSSTYIHVLLCSFKHSIRIGGISETRLIYVLTDKRNATTKNQSCFIQAVISSNYVEINQQKILAVSCFEGISNCVQQYHQPGVNQAEI